MCVVVSRPFRVCPERSGCDRLLAQLASCQWHVSKIHCSKCSRDWCPKVRVRKIFETMHFVVSVLCAGGTARTVPDYCHRVKLILSKKPLAAQSHWQHVFASQRLGPREGRRQRPEHTAHQVAADYACRKSVVEQPNTCSQRSGPRSGSEETCATRWRPINPSITNNVCAHSSQPHTANRSVRSSEPCATPCTGTRPSTNSRERTTSTRCCLPTP